MDGSHGHARGTESKTDPAPKPIAERSACKRCAGNKIDCDCGAFDSPTVVKPIADRIRDVADTLDNLYKLGMPPATSQDLLRAIASEIEEKAEEMRNEWYRTGQAEDRILRKAIDDVARWADSLARRKD